jgi:predicted MFS family arabinose efflux permease
LLSAPIGQVLNQDFGWRIGLFGFVALALLIVPAAWYVGRIDRIPLPKPSAEQLGNLSAGAAVATAFSSAAFVAMTCVYFVAACSSSSSPRICRLTRRSVAWSRC